MIAYGLGETARTVLLLAESLALVRDLGYRQGIALSLSGLGEVAYAQDEPAFIQSAVKMIQSRTLISLKLRIHADQMRKRAYFYPLSVSTEA